MNWTHQDRWENLVVCEDGVVTVKLKGEHKTRFIGSYNIHGHFLKGYPNPLSKDKHKFHKNNGYGVNYWVVERLESDDKKVFFITEEGTFWITKKEIKLGKVLCFSKQGFELQYIIPLNLMHRR